MSKLNLTDTLEDNIFKMGEGNPGAIVTIVELFKQCWTVDPQNLLGGVGVLLQLDEMGIYGSRIYLLGARYCNHSIPRTLTVLRAVQLGYYTKKELISAINDQVDLTVLSDELLKKVQAFMPAFNGGKPF